MREPIRRVSAIDWFGVASLQVRAFVMSETERSNILQALDLRHDEALESLAELDRQVEQAIAKIRPQAGGETPTATGRKKTAA